MDVFGDYTECQNERHKNAGDNLLTVVVRQIVGDVRVLLVKAGASVIRVLL